jgi:signal transduction histidine kinase
MKQVQSSVRRAEDQTERMRRLVDRLLDVSQLASGKLKVDLAPCDLSNVIKDAAERFLEDALNGGTELRLTVADGIHTRADKFRLDEAIGNVISNAIKYGGGKPVDIQLRTKGDKALLVVQDRGIGIPVEDLERIFGRFERTAVSRNYGGLGLGLFIAHQIIEQHAGSIRAESRSGGGARIVIELPHTANSKSKGKE